MADRGYLGVASPQTVPTPAETRPTALLPRVGDVIDSDTRSVWLLSWPSIHCLINRPWSIQANATANLGKRLWSVKEGSLFISRLQRNRCLGGVQAWGTAVELPLQQSTWAGVLCSF